MLHFLVEGQTEEKVARDLIQPHFDNLGWYTSVSLLKTKGPPAARHSKVALPAGSKSPPKCASC